MVVELPLVFPRFQPEVAVPAGQIIPDPNEEVVDGCIDVVPEVNTVVEEPLAQSAMLIMSPFSVTGAEELVTSLPNNAPNLLPVSVTLMPYTPPSRVIAPELER